MTRSPKESGTFRLVTLGHPRLDIPNFDLAHPPRPTGPGKSLALITYLAFAPRRTASRETLCDLLWGDRPVEQSRPQLRQTLWLIKTQIHPTLVTADSESVTLSTALTSDADEFTAAIEANETERAIALYSGDFFTGYAAPGAGRFEEWASLERTRFRTLFVQTSESVARKVMDSGRFPDAIALARRIRAIDPNGQTGWRLLLEARAASGDSVGARADAGQFEEWLQKEEWDAEPASIAALDRARRATKPSSSPANENDLAAELIGRAREFATIHDAWVTATTKGARNVHILAESGIGKTRLTRDVMRRIRASRGRTRYIRANYGERCIPFSFASAIAGSLTSIPGSSGIAAGAAATLVALNPSLSATFPQISTSPERLETLRVGLALLEIISAVADEDPVAIALDDMHWCDEQTREALTVVFSRLKNENVLLITTARPRYAAGPSRSDAIVVRLQRLTEAEVGEFVTSLARLPETPWAANLPAQLSVASGGNPLHLLEALRFCLDAGVLLRENEGWRCPDADALASALAQTAIVDRRLAALSSSENSILLMLAIAGAPATRGIVTEAAGLDAAQMETSAASLELRGLLVVESDLWMLAHDAIAETIIDHAEPQSIKDAHHRLGVAMTECDDSLWRKRAIQHLAEASEWNQAAASARPFLRHASTTSVEVDTAIGALLGSAATATTIARVRKKLPLTVRRPALIRQGIAAAVLLLAAVGTLAFSRSRNDRREPGPMLVALSRTPDGKIEVRRTSLDLDRWNLTTPLDASSRRAVTTWTGSPFDLRALARPGTESWVANAIYPDSGGGEIDLIDRDGLRRRLTWSRGDDRPASFSPDGTQLLFLTTRWSATGWSDVAVLDLATLAVRRITNPGATYGGAQWSPDGTRISYGHARTSAGGGGICVAGADGSGARCQTAIADWRLGGAIGWLDDKRLLVSADSSETPTQWAIYDVDRETVVKWDSKGVSSRPGEDEILLDPTGAWARAGQTLGGRSVVRVFPTSRPELARAVTYDTTLQMQLRFASPALSDSFLDSVAILSPQQELAILVPHQLVALGWSRTRRSMSPATVQWRSLTPAIATVDSLGILLATDTGSAIIEISAGGWRQTVDTLHITPAVVSTLLDERWNPKAIERWRVFGVPVPVIVNGGTANAFSSNGDNDYFSGAYLRTAFSAEHGLAMDLDVSTRITRTQWQVVMASLNSFQSAERIRQWNHKTGYSGEILDEQVGCSFAYPEGEGEGANTPGWFPGMRAAMADSTYRLDNGDWYRVRLQLFPDGRCGLAINGHALKIHRGVGPARKPVRPVLQGMSVGTRILVGRLVLRSGVPTDIDWTRLRFTGPDWERSSNNSSGPTARQD